MIMITVQVSYWEGHLAISFKPEDDCVLREAGLLNGANYVFDDDTILVAPEVDGAAPAAIRVGAYAEWQGASTINFTRGEACRMVRFPVTEMEAVIEGDTMMISLDPPHWLPWYYPFSQGRTNLGEIACREFKTRIASAHNAHEGWRPPPDRIRRLIPRSYWSGELKALHSASH